MSPVTVTTANTAWPAPPMIGRRFHPSTLFFVPTASGGMAVRRIVQRLLRDEYTEFNQMDFWKNGDETCTGSADWPWQADGHLYHVMLAQPLERWFERRPIDLTHLRLIITIRDPRDSILSLYHLTNEPVHASGAANKPIAASYAAEAERVRAWSAEEYVAARFSSQLPNLRTIRRIAQQLRPENICFLSYAQLCEDFPRFLGRLIDFLRIRPRPEVIDELLLTEDVRYKDRLTRHSLSHCANASPMPGRHKRELSPETITRITVESRDILAWLAACEVPSLSSIYLDGETR